ncbi:Alpha/Beta hydrolase protein [Penicillium atrosanguineum]|nr:Alpha/Beta hydrolase protein [Penicillium atrosanguineum]
MSQPATNVFGNMYIIGRSLFLLFLAPLPVFAGSMTELPVVDLGYALHRATSLNVTGNFYNFSNIRYGAPPTGNLRFRAPQPATTNRSEVHDGSVGRICPQAYPKWFSLETAFMASYLDGVPFNESTNPADYPFVPLPTDPRTTEDCLFLDVLVPKEVMDKKGHARIGKGAPVLVWIYGGGYTFGDKTTQSGSPGLIARSKADGSDGVIYVSFNYRLGAFGWLAGPSFSKQGSPNVGLLDQQLALLWVQKYIRLFGGDPQRVTVFGESAGAGSIMHQVTAYAGKRGPRPFQQGLMQSPGYLPVPQKSRQEQVYRQFIDILNVTTIEAARQLPSDVLISANAYHVGEFSYYGDFTYGPVVDGDFVPELPGILLQRGEFFKELKVMVGSNSNEGLPFTPPSTTDQSGYLEYLQNSLPGVSHFALEYISQVLYPPIFNDNFGYTTGLERGALTHSDLAFQCNTDFVNRAFNGETYAYRFSIPPGVHAEDLPYTFFNGPDQAVQNSTVALILQDYIVNFAKSGIPSSSIGPVFETHGDARSVQNIGLENILTTLDPAASERCQWWQNAAYAS